MSAQIYELMPKVMADVGAIEKGRKNTQQNYAFRGIDDVLSAFQPVLAKHQVFFIPEVLNKEVTDRESKSGNVLIYTTLQVAYTFYAPDGSSVRAVVVGEAMDSADKSSNKAMSAALKYALLQIFCVPTEANEDADATTHDVRPRQPAKPAATRPQAVPPAADAAPSPTVFWQLQKAGNVPKEQAQQIVNACPNDWTEAVSRLKTVIAEIQKAA